MMVMIIANMVLVEIDTQWNVNVDELHPYSLTVRVEIDTQWNVNDISEEDLLIQLELKQIHSGM